MATYPKVPQEAYGSYEWLRREVGGYLGYGYAEDSWNSEQSGKVDSILQSGLMAFYYPPPLPNKDGAIAPHRWSFLSPVAELSLVSGTREYDLPEDFSGALEGFTVG